MTLTKLFRPYTGTSKPCAQIHGNHYSCDFNHISSMVAELKKDFPEINDVDIQVQKYGGRRVKGVTFIEIFLPKDAVMPAGYKSITEIEYIL